MRIIGFAAGVAVSFLVGSSAEAAPPVEAFGSLPAMSHPHLSPDGKHLAAIEPVNGHPDILVFEVGNPAAKPQAFTGVNWFPIDVKWVNNDRVMGFLKIERMVNERTGRQVREYVRAVSISISGKGEPVLMMNNKRLVDINNGTAQVVGLDPQDPNSIFMEAWDWNKEMPTDSKLISPEAELNLYRVSVDDGKADLVEEGTTKTIDWIVDTQGHAAARLDQDLDLQTTVYVRDGSRSWRSAFTYDSSAGTENVVLGTTADGGSLAVLRYGSRDIKGIDTYPVSGSAFGPALFADATYDVDSYVQDDWTNGIVGARYYADKLESSYSDPKLQAIQKALEKALPGETVDIVSWDQAREHFIVRTESPREPSTYNLFTHTGGQFTALATEYPNLQPADLGDMKPYSYAASDGRTIHAYLTLPPGKPAKNLPTVIFPHGGPEIRDGLGFDWWAQFMASRGYAVLQPNFRGSSGYGWNFTKASFGQWGTGKMQGDITDGVKKLIADGIADPKRICIVGAAYGGYAALAGATFTPDLYACAVSFAGLADAGSVLGNATKYTGKDSEAVNYWRSRLGTSATDAVYLASISPARHAGDVKVPILLIHCKNDLTVPIDQSVLEEGALKNAGKNVQFVQIDGDDHYMTIAATRIEVLKQTEAFLKAHIGN